MRLFSLHVLAAGILGCFIAAAGAVAQSYPAKPIRVINPYTAGGGVDALLRPLAQKMSEDLKQQLVIDNRPGANGMIGMEAGAKALPDGYTLVIGTTGSLTMNVSIYAKVPFDPIKDFAPISNFADSAFILSVHPSVPANNVKALATPEVRERITSFGAEPVGNTPEEFAAQIRSDIAKWAKVTRAANVRAD